MHRTCHICLKESKTTSKLCELASNTKSWQTNLRIIIPEVEWLNDYCICETCTTHVESVLAFRKVCIHLEEQRRRVWEVKSEQTFTNYVCNETFPTSLTRNIEANHCNHAKFDNEQPTLICSKCQKMYKTAGELAAHRRNCFRQEEAILRHSNKRQFTCEVCNIVKNTAKAIVEHCVVEHQMEAKLTKPYSCLRCEGRFASSANLIQHTKYHDGNRDHVCSYCGKTFITKSDLTVHEYTHINKRNYKCDKCAKAFNTNKNLRSHILVVHTEAVLWKYACTMCEKRFPLKSGYDQHVRRHLGDKRFPCYICSKSFVSRNELNKHMTFHSATKPFRCTYCPSEYKGRRVLEVHLARVHGIGDAKVPPRLKKFVCHICLSAFCDRQKLQRHSYYHSGIRPFPCTKCDKKFVDKDYLKQHLKTMHNDVKESRL